MYLFYVLLGDIPSIEELSINEFYYKYVESYIYTLETSHKHLHEDGNPDEFAFVMNQLNHSDMEGFYNHHLHYIFFIFYMCIITTHICMYTLYICMYTLYIYVCIHCIYMF